MKRSAEPSLYPCDARRLKTKVGLLCPCGRKAEVSLDLKVTLSCTWGGAHNVDVVQAGDNARGRLDPQEDSQVEVFDNVMSAVGDSDFASSGLVLPCGATPVQDDGSVQPASIAEQSLLDLDDRFFASSSSTSHPEKHARHQ